MATKRAAKAQKSMNKKETKQKAVKKTVEENVKVPRAEKEVAAFRKTFVGEIVSDKMMRTVIVEIQRKVQHLLYKKMMRKTKRLKADTNGIEVAMGDIVKIEEVRPLSKTKNFKVVQKIQ